MAKSFWMEKQEGNFSNDKNDTFDDTKHYVGVRIQQGVPLLDRDWNESEDIRRYQELSIRRYLGDGTPDDGFKIGALATPGNGFIISKGRYLVDGFEVVNDADTSYSPQIPDDLKSVATPTTRNADGAITVDPWVPRKDMVYLEAWISEVKADPDNKDDPLSNPQDLKIETCIRHKLEWRVVMVPEGRNGPAGDQYHHYTLLAIINGGSPTITASQIIDKRTRIGPLSKAAIKDDAGNLSIDGKLNVDGDLVVSGKKSRASGICGLHVKERGIWNTGPGAVYVFGDRDLKSPSWSWYAEGGVARLWSEKAIEGTNIFDRLLIDINGNTWISGKLNISGDINISGYIVEINHGSTVPINNADIKAAGLKLVSPNGGGLIYGYDTNNSIFLRAGLDGDKSVIDFHAFGRLRFFTGGQLNDQKEMMRINEAGKVGIGTATPQRILHAEGEIHSGGTGAAISFASRTDKDGKPYGEFNEKDAGKRFAWVARNEVARLWTPSKGDLLSIDKDGNVEINHGSTVPINNADIKAAGLKLVSPNGGGLIYGYDTNNSIFLRAGLDGDKTVIDFHAFGKLRFFTGGQLNDQKEMMRINEAGNVGIGTNSPAGKLDVIGDIRAGNSDIYFTKTDHKHTGFGNAEGCAAIENCQDYGALMILGRTTKEGRIVQLWDNLSVQGNVIVAGNVKAASFTPPSDIRFKTNIKPLKDILNKLEKIRGVSFEWNSLDPFKHDSGKRDIGLIAQEVERIFPEIITSWGDEKYLGIDYNRLTSVLVEAIKELKGIVKEQSDRISILERAAALK
jgi:hypothetical protein